DHDDLIENAGLAQLGEHADDLAHGLRALPGRHANRHAAVALGRDPLGRIERMVEGAGFRPALGDRRGHRLYYLKPVALDRRIEPWSALLDAGREDGRLVREAAEGPGRAKLVEPPGELHPDVLGALVRL